MPESGFKHKKPRSAEHRAKISERLKIRHALGLTNSHTESANKKRAESIKKGWISGTRKQRDPEELRNHLQSAYKKRDLEKMREINKRIGIAQRGGENPPGPSAKGPEHWAGKMWRFRAANGIILEGRNLSHLIRENSHLFNPDDVVWKKSQCRAQKGLSMLYANHGKSCSWKGWIALCEGEFTQESSR
jgi:hypothetical protein